MTGTEAILAAALNLAIGYGVSLRLSWYQRQQWATQAWATVGWSVVLAAVGNAVVCAGLAFGWWW